MHTSRSYSDEGSARGYYDEEGSKGSGEAEDLGWFGWFSRPENVREVSENYSSEYHTEGRGEIHGGGASDDEGDADDADEDAGDRGRWDGNEDDGEEVPLRGRAREKGKRGAKKAATDRRKRAGNDDETDNTAKKKRVRKVVKHKVSRSERIRLAENYESYYEELSPEPVSLWSRITGHATLVKRKGKKKYRRRPEPLSQGGSASSSDGGLTKTKSRALREAVDAINLDNDDSESEGMNESIFHKKKVGKACLYWLTGPATLFNGHRKYIFSRWPDTPRMLTCNFCLVGWGLDLCSLREMVVMRNLRKSLPPQMPEPVFRRNLVKKPPRIVMPDDESMIRTNNLLNSGPPKPPKRRIDDDLVRRNSIAPPPPPVPMKASPTKRK